MGEAKTCRDCGDEKLVAEFYADATRSDGRAPRCKECDNRARRERREAQANEDAVGAMPPDDRGRAALAAFGLPIERECVEALSLHGDIAGAAEALGLTASQVRAHLSELRRRAATRGWSPAHDMQKTAPEGYHLKGVSTYYKAVENPETGETEMVPRGQWVKTNKDAVEQLAALADAVQAFCAPWVAAAEPVPPPVEHLDEDLLAVYPMGDPHVGLYTWAEEVGENFDLKIAEAELVGVADKLVALAPAAKHALVINLGDFFHSDTPMNRTARSGHALDVDGRFAKVQRIGIRIMRRIIDRALEKHEHVTVVNEIGNHDDQSALMLAICLAQFYEREPRVTIDTSPAKFHWYRFGKCLLGVTHGDTCKMKDLGEIMANDRPHDWGETEHRHWFCGHVHHDSVKELRGVTVETFRTLAPGDAWHRAAGYRAGRDMKVDVFHREHGRISRSIVGINQMKGRSR